MEEEYISLEEFWKGIKQEIKNAWWNYFHPFSKWREYKMRTTLKQKQDKQV